MSGQIIGTVTGANGHELSGASVVLRQEDGSTILASTTTDTSGGYEFTDVTAGEYAVTAEDGSLGGERTVCTVKDGETTTNNIQFLPKELQGESISEPTE